MQVIIADRKSRIRSALHLLLEQETDLGVAGEATCPAELQQLLPGARLLLIDIRFCGPETPILLARLRRQRPDLVIIGMGSTLDDRAEVPRNTLDAFISKSDAPQQVLQAILTAAKQRPSL